MDTRKKMVKLKKLGVFTPDTAKKRHGLSQSMLYRLVSEGSLLRAGSGYYIHPQSKLPAESVDFAVACSRFGPKSIIGGLTALSHYHLIEQVPQNIWIIVPPSKMSRNKLYRCLRAKKYFRYGIEDNGFYRITSLERTLIEALKFSSKIGIRIIIQAIRKAIADGLTTEKKLGVMAEQLKMKSALHKYWEYIVQ